jgi:membrane fusion protein, multidrug efflux system
MRAAAGVLAGLVALLLSGGVSVAAAQSLAPAGGERLVRVQLAPAQYTTLSAEIAARVEHLPYREGQRFARGEVLVQLDCAMYRARLDRAEAEALEARTSHDVNERLQGMGSISLLEIGVSAARKAVTEADVRLMRTLVDRCVIRAPFAGRVVQQAARAHQYVAEGQSVMEILDDRTLEVEMVLPSQWLRWLAPGLGFEVRIDEIGGSFPATVDRVGARVDPVSQSVRVFGVIASQDSRLMAGMSGVAVFAQ